MVVQLCAGQMPFEPGKWRQLRAAQTFSRVLSEFDRKPIEAVRAFEVLPFAIFEPSKDLRLWKIRPVEKPPPVEGPLILPHNSKGQAPASRGPPEGGV